MLLGGADAEGRPVHTPISEKIYKECMNVYMQGGDQGGPIGGLQQRFGFANIRPNAGSLLLRIHADCIQFLIDNLAAEDERAQAALLAIKRKLDDSHGASQQQSTSQSPAFT